MNVKIEKVVVYFQLISYIALSALNRNWNFDNRLNVNGNNWNDNDDGHSFGIVLIQDIFIKMKTNKNLYNEIHDIKNLVLAWKKARKGKTKKDYVVEFEKNLPENLKALHHELKSQTYRKKPLKTIVHHALCNIIESIFDKTFIYDNCANRKCKGNLFANQRFHKFKRKVSRNGEVKGWFNNNQVKGYCFKADIKHYFQEIDCGILMKIIQKKIKDDKVIRLIREILDNTKSERERERDASQSINNKGMPLGNLTSQFFANVYLNELDYFVKHKLKAKYYIRYVDDFVILSSSKLQLKELKKQIEKFLNDKLKLELHSDKSKIISLSRGIDFVGFRNFYYFKLLRKRNIKNMERKIEMFSEGKITDKKLAEIFQGWNAYSKWANGFNLRKKIMVEIQKTKNITGGRKFNRYFKSKQSL